MSQPANPNPYAKASGAYGKQAQETSTDQRQLEAHVLLKAATELQHLQDRWDEATAEDVDNILSYNRKLWLVFFDAAVGDEESRPIDIRNNIVNLANFVFKRSINILAEPDKSKLTVLIEINRQLAAGLMQKPAGAENAAGGGNTAPEIPAASGNTDTSA